MKKAFDALQAKGIAYEFHDYKKQGFKFVGPTTCYAFMQAVGMVNDHENSCHFK